MIEFFLPQLEAYHKETHDHVKRCGPMLARLAHLENEDDLLLKFYEEAGNLHDIGKLKVPIQILDKPTELTPLEMGIMENHPQHSFNLIKGHFPTEPKRGIVLQAALYHHEYYDRNAQGRVGYPRQITGERIPRAARMMAVIDVWDALTHDRAYRKAWSPGKAEEELAKLACNKLDPDLTNKFLREHSNNSFADVEVIKNSVAA